MNITHLVVWVMICAGIYFGHETGTKLVEACSLTIMWLWCLWIIFITGLGHFVLFFVKNSRVTMSNKQQAFGLPGQLSRVTYLLLDGCLLWYLATINRTISAFVLIVSMVLGHLFYCRIFSRMRETSS